MLVNHGADIGAKNSNDKTPLLLSESIILEFLFTILNKNDIVFNACKVGNLQKIIECLQEGFFIDTKHNDYFLIQIATQNGHLGVVEYLVNQKADINAKDNNVVLLNFM